jgi:cytochrome c-type biogenesis protein CcmF
MLGSIVLILAFIASLTAMVMYYLSFKGYKNTLNIGRIAYHSMAMLIIVASTILLYAILTHDYSFKYIYSYTKTDLPKGILAATFWAGQEGSFMLWILLTAIVGIVLQSYSSKRGDLEPRVMAVFTLATSFLLIMVLPMFKNPFAYIWSDPVFVNIANINSALLNQPWIQSFLFSDPQTGQNFVKVNTELAGLLKTSGIAMDQFIINGRGLNPQLLNFWMQIHPPILFVGFAMATVPFCFAIAALMKNDYREWITQAFPWVLSGMGILGLGIMLGGYWAYEMLGWGGYWAWDPVENSSLIPWLIGVASIHTFLVQKRSQSKGGIGKYAKTNLVLALATYILVIYSTFLTRSGILGDASVHSFVDPGTIVYLFLVIFISSFILLGAGMIAFRWKYLNENIVVEEGLFSRDLALFTGTVVLVASAIIVLVGTSAPIFGRSVDTFFYNEMHLPIAIIIGVLNGMSLLLKWKDTKKEDFFKRSMLSVGMAVGLTALIGIFGKITDFLILLLAFSASFALFVNGEIALKVAKGNWKKAGAYVAHIGIAIFILGVIGSAAYSKEVDIDLVKNVPKEAFGYQMKFTGYSPIENNTKYAFNIDITKGDARYSIAPVMYVSEFNNSLMREPAILTTLTRDFYIAPLGYEDANSHAGHDHGEESSVTLNIGESSEFNGVKVTFKEFVFDQAARDAMMAGGDFDIGVNLITEHSGHQHGARVALESRDGNKQLTSTTVDDANLRIELVNLDASGKIQLKLSTLDGTGGDGHGHDDSTSGQEILSITASVKPFINLVWAGVIVTVLGFFVAVGRRQKESVQ